MIIDLITLRNSPFNFEYSLAPDEVDLGSDEAKLKNAVEIKGELTKHIAQTDIEGEIFAEIEVECSRCLQTADERFTIPFSVSYVTPELYTEEKESELGADDLQVSIFDGAAININELVREQILLNTSEQIFCREDCQGLCQQCGANRNLIDCKCIEKDIDPRWAKLKEIK